LETAVAAVAVALFVAALTYRAIAQTPAFRAGAARRRVGHDAEAAHRTDARDFIVTGRRSATSAFWNSSG
jgi:hypothetical protein